MKSSDNFTLFRYLPLFLALCCFSAGWITGTQVQAQATSDHTSAAAIIPHTYPTICPASKDYTLRVNGLDLFVYYTSAGSFATLEADGEVEVELFTREPVKGAMVYPRRLGIDAQSEEHTVKFRFEAPEKLMIEIPGMEQLFIYAMEPAPETPDPDGEGIHYFRSGQLHEVGLLELKEHETVYMEAGAVVRGSIRATSATGVKISGYGVLDHGFYRGVRGRPKFVLLEDCRESVIEDIIMIEPQTWMITLYHCDVITVDNVKQLGSGHGSDGVDIVGSDNIHVKDCMLRNGDDCIVVKSFRRPQYTETVLNQWDGVKNVSVTGCAVQSNGGGQAFEIGHELTRGPIRDIRFSDCDVMGVHGQGGVFGIHNSDHAHIQNITYENIRVDHFYNKLVDLRIVRSRWSETEERGSAENILLKDIDVEVSVYNPGYSISLIGGYDEDHRIENVTFENFRLDGKRVTGADQMDLYVRQAGEVVFK